MSELAPFSGVLIDAALRCAGLLAMAGMITLALRGRSAGERHAVWAAALVGLLIVPAVSVILPAWRMPVVSEALSATIRWVPAGSAPAGTADATVPLMDSPPPTGQTRAAGAAEVPASSADDANARDPDVPGLRSRAEFAAATDAAGPLRGRRATHAGRGTVGTEPRPGTVWRAWLVAVWAAGAALLLTFILLDLLRLRRIVERTRPAPMQSRLERCVRFVTDEMGVSVRPSVRLALAGTMPMTWGFFRPVILLPSGAEGWSSARMEAVLRHELAHVRRADYVTQFIGSVACAVHWFNPLAWMALARMRRERELACDDEVLSFGADPAAYAAELLYLARERRDRVPAGALAVARGSQLGARIRAVLHGPRARSRMTRRSLARVTGAAALAFVLAAVVAPAESETTNDSPPPRDTSSATPDGGLQQGALPRESAVRRGDSRTDGPLGSSVVRGGRDGARHVMTDDEAASTGTMASVAPGDDWTRDRASLPLPWLPDRVPACLAAERPASRRAQHDDGNWRIEIHAPDCSLTVTFYSELADGEPAAFDRTFRRIVQMEPGSRLDIQTDESRVGTRRLTAEPDDQGRPVIWYWRDGVVAPFDQDAEEWLAGILVPVLRYTGIRAPERTAYILATAGPSGVFRELERIGTDRVQSLYLTAFVDQTQPDAAQLDVALATAARLIGSDSEMRKLLVNLVERRSDLPGQPVRAAFREAMSTVGSDGDHATLLLALFERAGSVREVEEVLLASARAEIGSDSDMARFLGHLAEVHPNVLDGAVADAFWACVATIGSDETMRAALNALAGEHPQPPVLTRVLSISRAHIGSDAEMGAFLEAFAGRHRTAVRGPVRDFYRAAAATISSDAARERALAATSP